MTVAHPLAVQLVGSTPRDWFDWTQVVIAPVAALGAAWFGAKVGGREATKATLAALREEMEVERGHRLALLNQRIVWTLEQIGAFPKRFEGHDKEDPLSLPKLRDIVTLWSTYERASDHAGLYPDRKLIGEIEQFFQDVRIEAEQAIHVEEVLGAFREKLQPPTRGEESNYFAGVRLEAEAGREETLRKFAAWPETAAALLERHNACVARGVAGRKP